MRVPNLSGLEAATEAVPTPEIYSKEQGSKTQYGRRPRNFGRSSALRQFTHSTSSAKGTAIQQEQTVDKREDGCPEGQSFFSCSNGFFGCCAHNPCNPGGSCNEVASESQTAKTPQATATTEKPTPRIISYPPLHTQSHLHHTKHISASGSSSGHPQSSHTRTPHSSHDSGLTSTSSSTAQASSHSNSTSSTSSASEPTATVAPLCPAGNGTHFTDSSKIEYIVYCATDNKQSSYQTVSVGSGGYGKCFNSCSHSKSCAGFTYVGLKTGKCFLKYQMPNDTYVPTSSSNYISCAKLDPSAGISIDKPKKTGIIAGAVIGGVVLFVLLFWLIATLARRRRKKIEDRRATITHVISGPLEMTQQYQLTGHRRQGSSSHDVYQPQGGIYRGTTPTQSNLAAQTHQSPIAIPSGNRMDDKLTLLPSTVYRRPPKPSAASAIVNSRSIRPQFSRESGSGSPHSQEHAEPCGAAHSQGSPSTDTTNSPTVGRPFGSKATAFTNKYESSYIDTSTSNGERMTLVIGYRNSSAARGPEGLGNGSRY